MLFEDTYKTIAGTASGIYKEKGSKFLAFAYHVEKEEDAKQIIDNLRKEYYDARHHCYAYIIGKDKSCTRVNDDGEPSGTAGKPIFNQLQSYDLTNILLIVIRYFGGIKLGVSGLINAYKLAARNAIESSEIKELTINEFYQVCFPFEMINDAMKIAKEYNLQISETNFENEASFTFKVRKSSSEKVVSKFKSIYRFQVIYRGSE